MSILKNVGSFGLPALLTMCLLAPAAFAQTTMEYPPEAPEGMPTTMSVDELTMYDLSGMTAAWWDRLAERIDEDLGKEKENQDQAMRKVIFLATYYPDKANFDRSTTELYNIYRFNQNEEFRVMALAALYASGDDSAMRLIAYHAPYTRYAPWEESDLVRHVTEAALMRYYGTPSVTVEPPQVIGGNRGQ